MTVDVPETAERRRVGRARRREVVVVAGLLGLPVEGDTAASAM